MKNKYNYHIDDIYNKDALIASILLDNREALILHGNNISIKDLK